MVGLKHLDECSVNDTDIDHEQLCSCGAYDRWRADLEKEGWRKLPSADEKDGKLYATGLSWVYVGRDVYVRQSWDQREWEQLRPYLPDIVKNAMLVAWREICADTGCHPLDIEHSKGRFLTFEPRHWAQMAGDLVAASLERFWSEQASYADLRASGGIAEAP